MHSAKCESLNPSRKTRLIISQSTHTVGLMKIKKFLFQRVDLSIFIWLFTYMKATSCPCQRVEDIKAQTGWSDDKGLEEGLEEGDQSYGHLLKRMASHLIGLELAGVERRSKVCSPHTTYSNSQKTLEVWSLKDVDSNIYFTFALQQTTTNAASHNQKTFAFSLFILCMT